MANLDEIIQASGAVMVARGDLGVECALEELPVVQRRIIERCSHFGRKVIVATEMLESMRENAIPTRAEITDIFNAVNERVDCVMLSAETSIGKYPVRCVETLDRVCKRVEAEFPDGRLVPDAPLTTDQHKTVSAATALANSIPGSHLLVFTQRGIMGHLVAHMRPREARIFAFTPNLDAARSLLMARGVTPFHRPLATTPDENIEGALNLLKKRKLIEDGAPVVITSDVLHQHYEVDSILWRKA